MLILIGSFSIVVTGNTGWTSSVTRSFAEAEVGGLYSAQAALYCLAIKIDPYTEREFSSDLWFTHRHGYLAMQIYLVGEVVSTKLA